MAWLLCLMLGGHLPGEGSCEPGLALWPGLARRGWCRARAGAQLWLCVSVSQRQDTEYHQPSLTIILPVKVITIPHIIFIGAAVKIYMSYSDVLLRL